MFSLKHSLTACLPESLWRVAGQLAGHGEALMRRRKEWYYQREPRPGVSVIGDRLLELAFSGRR